VFVVLVRYQVPLARIDELLAAHRAFLDRLYAEGAIVASGPQVPRAGGVILARGSDEATVRATFAQDPFAREGAATYEFVQFDPTRTAPGLEALRG